MPVLADLQKTLQPKQLQRKVVEQSWDDERLVVDERCGRTSANFIEEKLTRLLVGVSRSVSASARQ